MTAVRRVDFRRQSATTSGEVRRETARETEPTQPVARVAMGGEVAEERCAEWQRGDIEQIEGNEANGVGPYRA